MCHTISYCTLNSKQYTSKTATPWNQAPQTLIHKVSVLKPWNIIPEHPGTLIRKPWSVKLSQLTYYRTINLISYRQTTYTLNPVLKPPHNRQIFHMHQHSPLKNKPSLVCARMIYPSSTSPHMWDYAFPFILLACPSWQGLIFFSNDVAATRHTPKPWTVFPRPYTINNTIWDGLSCARYARFARFAREARFARAIRGERICIVLISPELFAQCNGWARDNE